MESDHYENHSLDELENILQQSSSLFTSNPNEISTPFHQYNNSKHIPKKSNKCLQPQAPTFPSQKHPQPQPTQPQNRPNWNNCTKPIKVDKIDNPAPKTKLIKEGRKVCEQRAEEMKKRNDRWVEEKDRKVFEKSRLQFMRMKELCYFSPKIL